MAGIIQALTFYTASAIDATQTSIQVRGLKDSRGNYITSMPAGVTILYATIEPRSPANQEIVSFTGITDNGNGIVTLTGVIRNLNPQPPFTALTANVPHGNNAEMILSNNPPFYSGFLQSDANVVITGNFQFPTPTLPNNAATKQYVDGIAIAGAADASVIQKGVTRLSVDPSVSLGNPTISIATPAVVTLASHGLTVDDSIKFTTTGTLPTGLLPNVTYYVIAAGLTGSTFQLSGSLGGSAINTSGIQSGTHTLFRTTPRAVSDNDPRIPSALQVANIPTTGEKASLAGTQGVPSSTNKTVLNDATSAADVDQQQTTQNASVEAGESDVTLRKRYLAQSFTAGKTKIRGVRLYKTADSGTFTGTVTIELRPDSAGSPSASVLASIVLTNSAWLALSVGEITALFSAEYASLVAGSLYWIVVNTSTADNANHPNFGTNSAGGYASGSVKYFNTTDGWVTAATIDLYFKTLEGVNSQVIKTGSDGKLPSAFYDISKMPLPAYFQELATNNGTESLSSTEFSAGCSNDGSVLFFRIQGSGAIYRYQRDAVTGMYKLTHSVTPTLSTPSGDTSSMIVIGIYMYLFSNNGTNLVCSRFLAADLTGETVMTVPTVASTGGALAYTDGADAYLVSSNSTTTLRRWVINGTVMTEPTTYTCVNFFNNDTMMMTDGTNLYSFDSNYNLYKYTDMLASGRANNAQQATTYAAVQVGAFIMNIDTTRIYIGRIFAYADATAQVAVHIYLTPIAKP